MQHAVRWYKNNIFVPTSDVEFDYTNDEYAHLARTCVQVAVIT